jgi:hypothetical protein
LNTLKAKFFLAYRHLDSNFTTKKAGRTKCANL